MGFYQESGKVNWPLTTVMAVLAIMSLLIIGYGYAFLTNLNPFIYINFLVTLGYVILTGVILNFAIKKGKVRNKSSRLLIAGIVSFVGLYGIWVSYVVIVFRSDFAYAFNNLFDAIDTLSYRGISIGKRSSSFEISGGLIYILWIIEAAILFVGPIFLVHTASKNVDVFCEDCDKWADGHTIHLKKREQTLTKESIEGMIKENRLNEVLAFENVLANHPDYYQFTFTTCKDCNKSHFLAVDHVTNTKNDKGNDEKNEDRIFPFYELDHHQVPRALFNNTATETPSS